MHLKIRDPIYCQPPKSSASRRQCPTRSSSLCPCVFLHSVRCLQLWAGCTELQPTPAPEQAAISFAEESEFLATFPAADTLLVWKRGRGRQESPCKRYNLLLRASHITFAAQEGNKPCNLRVELKVTSQLCQLLLHCLSGCSCSGHKPPGIPHSPQGNGSCRWGGSAASQQRCFPSMLLLRTLPHTGQEGTKPYSPLTKGDYQSKVICPT